MENNNMPCILEETDDFAVVYKPPKKHSGPIKRRSTSTLLEWYALHFPDVYNGGGLVHRLDFETHGLVLVAKHKKSLDFFNSLQNRGEFIKEYSAVCVKADKSVSILNFPDAPVLPKSKPSPKKPLVIESFFRPFGPGRKQVRPVTDDRKKHWEIAKDRHGYYRTEIIGINGKVFTVRIRRGFRHQIRCHLCWAGFPILNDPLYSYRAKYEPLPDTDTSVLSLRAQALFFIDPSSGCNREYRIAPLETPPVSDIHF